MNTNKSNDERQVNRPQEDNEQNDSMNKNKPGFHYVKHHGYAYDDFAEVNETVQFGGIRVVDESGSGESEEFEDFGELSRSEWSVNGASAARLSDGRILYEGRQ
jgi:hypothetical protein